MVIIATTHECEAGLIKNQFGNAVFNSLNPLTGTRFFKSVFQIAMAFRKSVVLITAWTKYCLSIKCCFLPNGQIKNVAQTAHTAGQIFEQRLNVLQHPVHIKKKIQAPFLFSRNSGNMDDTFLKSRCKYLHTFTMARYLTTWPFSTLCFLHF